MILKEGEYTSPNFCVCFCLFSFDPFLAQKSLKASFCFKRYFILKLCLFCFKGKVFPNFNVLYHVKSEMFIDPKCYVFHIKSKQRIITVLMRLLNICCRIFNIGFSNIVDDHCLLRRVLCVSCFDDCSCVGHFVI